MLISTVLLLNFCRMFYRIFPTLVLALGAFAALAQTPQSIVLQPGGKKSGQAKMMACPDQFAGTIAFANFFGQSNDIDLDTIYFCFGDEIDIVHNQDDDLSGDPNPLSAPGITYGYFNCEPTVTGPDLTSILADPCIITAPPPVNDLWITGGGQLNGNIQFSNTGNSQAIFNNGDPVLLWFAPITIDAFPNTYENDPVTMESGPCVNLNVAEAFAVVYLNEISTSGFNPNTGVSGCQGSFQVAGGLPEFDGSNYSFTINLLGNPGIQGTVVSGGASHGETVTFQVPVPGIYQVLIEDGKSCGGSFLANMSACTSVSQSVQNAFAAPGDQICLDVVNESGFNDIVSIQYGLTWDESVLQFTSVANLTPLLNSFSVANSFNSLGDSLVFSWGNLSGNGNTLPIGEVIYQLCFTVVGSDGDCTDIDFIIPQGSMIEVVQEPSTQLGFNGISGSVCVSSSALVLDLVQDSTSCPSAADGGFTATVSGGLPPYGVTWQKVGGGPIGGPGIINIDGGSFAATGLTAGVYNVTVTDAQGTPLVVTEQVEILSEDAFSILFTENPPDCNGETGSILATIVLDSVVVTNPLQNYTFQWNGNNGTATSISNVSSGLYSLTVTQTSTGCTVSGSTFLPQPPPLVVNVTVDSAYCSGVGDGALHVTVSGGTPNAGGDYTIEWPTIGAGLVVINASSNVTGLESGFYQLVVTDENGCSFDQNIWLPAKKVLSANALVNNLNCNSVCSGGIFVVATSTGGTPSTAYNFDWFGTPVPPPPVAETSTTSTLADLCVGSYTVVIEDQEGCEIDTTFTISAPNPLSMTLLNTQNETCTPGNDGSITVIVSGGVYPYSYTLNGVANDSTMTGLDAGAYTVIVNDDNLCADTVTATLTAPAPPTITSLPDATVSCATSLDGSLTVTATAGSAPIAGYLWTGGLVGQTVNGLGVGTYIVTVVDNSGCTDVDTAQVLAPPPLVVDSFTLIPPPCPGLTGGTVIAHVSGGEAPYFFNWSNGFSGNSFNVNPNVAAGSYSVTISDNNNCPPLIATTVLNDPAAILANFSAIDSVSCANTGQTCDGTATASALYSDGTTGIFNFIWQSGETDNSVQTSTAVQLCAGMQQLIVSDGTCNDTFTVNIPAPLPIVPGQTISNVSCDGLSDGEITLLPMGGTPPYDITWANGTQGPTISGLAAGNYTAVITDFNNCNFTHTVTIVEPDPFVVSLNPGQTSDVECPGDENGIITVVAQGGNTNLGPLVYLWGNGVAAPDASSATDLAPGTYSVTVVDVKGCSDSLIHTISEPPPILFTLGEILPIQCFGQNTFITVEAVSGGNPGATYQFSVDNGVLRLPGEPSPVFAGTHTVEVVDIQFGCTADTTLSLTEPQEISIELPDVVEIELGDSLTVLDPVIISSLPIDTFIWSPADQLSCADCKNPRVVNATQNQLYTLTIIDINGCAATAQVLVDLDRNRNVYLPNIFSPNGDGINDKFQVFTGIGVTRINFVRLYDRWGEKVFEESDLPPSPDGTPGWNGEFRGEDMNPAVFMYLVEVTFLDGQVLLYRGDVTLAR